MCVLLIILYLYRCIDVCTISLSLSLPSNHPGASQLDLDGNMHTTKNTTTNTLGRTYLYSLLHDITYHIHHLY